MTKGRRTDERTESPVLPGGDHRRREAGGAPREHIQALQMAREALGTVSSNNKSFRESIMKIHENRFERISRDEALKEESK